MPSTSTPLPDNPCTEAPLPDVEGIEWLRRARLYEKMNAVAWEPEDGTEEAEAERNEGVENLVRNLWMERSAFLAVLGFTPKVTDEGTCLPFHPTLLGQ